MTNKEISKHFTLLGKLVVLTGGNDFKATAFDKIAFKLSKFPGELIKLTLDELTAIDGVGSGTATKIIELKETGTTAELESLRSQVPAGVVQMLAIKGLGAKKVKVIWAELGIETLGELYYACNENRLVNLKGFGDKLQAEIKQNIEFLEAAQGKLHFYIAEGIGNEIVNLINKALPNSQAVLVGDLAMLRPVVEGMDVVCIATLEAVEAALNGIEYVSDISQYSQTNSLTAKLYDGYLLSIQCCSATDYEYTVFTQQSSPAHLAQLNYMGPTQNTNAQAVYSSLGLPYILPELREGRNEITLAKANALPSSLITMADIKGMLHNHSTYSDGMHTLRQMAEYCKSLGYEYLGISDHSASATYANGLKADRVVQQHLEIDALNAELAPFKIFKGIESDILNDGSLDYTDEVLATFDFIVASIHQWAKPTADEATHRLITAIKNPYTTILGHPTGRLLLAREGYPIHHEAVIDACAQYGVVIELNANPHRLDLDWTWIEYAVSKGVMISINPDAHKMEGYADTRFGVLAARKGFLTSQHTFNALTISQIENHFKAKKP